MGEVFPRLLFTAGLSGHCPLHPAIVPWFSCELWCHGCFGLEGMAVPVMQNCCSGSAFFPVVCLRFIGRKGRGRPFALFPPFLGREPAAVREPSDEQLKVQKK